jgi:hypothetical protein
MHKINFSKASNTLQHPAMAAGFSPIVWVQIPAYIYICKEFLLEYNKSNNPGPDFPPQQKTFFLITETIQFQINFLNKRIQLNRNALKRYSFTSN